MMALLMRSVRDQQARFRILYTALERRISLYAFRRDEKKKWANYVAECHAKGKEIDYDDYDWDK